MAENPLRNLQQFGQSTWFDYITRSMIDSGKLERLLTDDAIRGMTSNPSIFHQAMVKSDDYEDALGKLRGKGLSTKETYETLAVQDIQSAADHLRKIYDSSNGGDGFISLEVSPELAHDTAATLSEAVRLWKRVDRPNLMIKVPGTEAGIPAVEQLLTDGINVNVTLLFSLDNYGDVRAAYLKALENRLKAGKPLNNVASVASFFLSRIDSFVDKLLDGKIADGNNDAVKLKGKAAVASAKAAYQDYLKDFSSARFAELRAKGAKVQRPLWASTSTKNPDYSDLLYMEPLIGQDVINTLPPATVDAFRDHGVAKDTIGADIEDAYDSFRQLEEAGISMKAVTQELQDEGVQKFIDSFRELMTGLDEKLQRLSA